MVNPSPKLIAIVDDEEHIRRALRRLLNSAGYNVALFPGGTEFIGSLPGQRPDCVVLDLHMPTMDGFAVLEHRARQTRLPTVIVTGYDTPESRTRVTALGAAGYLRKPIDGQQLINAIEEALDSG